jgi:hypothetical protein
LYKNIENCKKPHAYFDFTKDVEATINTVKKYSLEFNEESVCFVKNNQFQFVLIIKADKFSDITKTLLSFDVDFHLEFTKLYDEFCISVGLEPVTP